MFNPIPPNPLDEQNSQQARNEKQPVTQADLRSVAQYQKVILFCILAYLVLGALHFALPPDVKDALALTIIVLSITATLFVFLLATKLDNTGLGLLLGILTLIPLIGLFALLIINAKATGMLKKHGIRVGLFGAYMSDFE
jgi:hypothetical protein